jgi:hypothetical protein
VASFAELVGRSAELMNTTRRHGRFDNRAAVAVTRSVVRSRGAEFELGCQFNDMWSTTAKPGGRRPGVAAELDRLAETTTFEWTEWTEAEGMVLFLDTRGTPERIQVFLMTDTALLAPAEIRTFLHAFERVAIALAETDIPLARVEELLGLTTQPV